MLHFIRAAALILCVLLPVLDLTRAVNLTGKLFRIPLLFLLPQFLLLSRFVSGYGRYPLGVDGVLCILSMTFFYCYTLLRFHVTPYRQAGGRPGKTERRDGGQSRTERRDGQYKEPALQGCERNRTKQQGECKEPGRNGNGLRAARDCTKRISILYGGQLLIRFSVWGFFVQGLFYLLFFLGKLPAGMSAALHETLAQSPLFFVLNGLLCVLCLFFLLLNGQLRVLFTCYRLGIVRRLLILMSLWIPVANLFLMHYLCRKALEEYDQERCRFTARAERADSQVCATRYPIVLVHGIGFRDLRYFNYWGRIPKELTRNGAVVYYGHQQAWGTIEDNAACLREKIGQVMEENHCDQVNLIAHSKGGLDARYLISRLDMAEHVASLTTVSTPHLGSELIDVLNRLPDNLYRLIASWFDRTFSRFGDRNPDCYHASKQLSPAFCAAFNKETPDRPGVYYQSYASAMKHSFSDSLLCLPHLIMDLAAKGRENDGLVTEKSARWGDFQGTFHNKYRRGISHGDMIDLKREDYRGFDIRETYVRIVGDLKKRGF